MRMRVRQDGDKAVGMTSSLEGVRVQVEAR